MHLFTVASSLFILSRYVSCQSIVSKSDSSVLMEAPVDAAYALNDSVSKAIRTIASNSIAANDAIQNSVNPKVIISKNNTAIFITSTTKILNSISGMTCGETCSNTGTIFGDSSSSFSRTIPSTSTSSTLPTATFIPRLSVAPNVETQVLLIGCIVPVYWFGSRHGPQVDKNNPPPKPVCPTQYVSNTGVLSGVDDPLQSPLKYFTIPSSNSTCQGIQTPFNLVESSAFKNASISNSSIVVNKTLSNSFASIDWTINCKNGDITLFNSSLYFKVPLDIPIWKWSIATTDKLFDASRLSLYAESMVPKPV